MMKECESNAQIVHQSARDKNNAHVACRLFNSIASSVGARTHELRFAFAKGVVGAWWAGHKFRGCGSTHATCGGVLPFQVHAPPPRQTPQIPKNVECPHACSALK